MKAILDTHAFLWFIAGDRRLSSTARGLIEDRKTELGLSVGSLWEVGIKTSLGKLQFDQPFFELMQEQLTLQRVSLIGIDLEHVAEVASLPFHHRDPFDRLIIAQAIRLRLAIISRDRAFDAYGVERLW